MPTYLRKLLTKYSQGVDKPAFVCYIVPMKRVKARVNKDGLMGSASRVHRPKKGKGSYRRGKKHKKIA
jgi:stalled ribosome alternative rescue factor ArfA